MTRLRSLLICHQRSVEYFYLFNNVVVDFNENVDITLEKMALFGFKLEGDTAYQDCIYHFLQDIVFGQGKFEWLKKMEGYSESFDKQSR
jgi:predicted Zn-dependent protease